MTRTFAGMLAAALFVSSVMTGLVVLGAATSLRPQPRDFAPATETPNTGTR